ncbi:MAG: DUF502 domain-containing protein [Chlamydiia bacterium]|nr:DUF502 domain-containing protein [Chlamydiia bacterium]
MKKCLATGLAIILPAVLTFMILNFALNALTKPFMGVVSTLLARFDLFNNDQIFGIPHRIAAPVISKTLIVIVLFFGTVFIGLLARWVVVTYFVRLGDWLIHQIPLINQVYKATKEVVETIFSDTKPNFKKVVLVPFPYERTLCLGLIASDPEDPKEDVSVFIPATPNPTMGFMILCKREKLIESPLSVEKALKVIISCGTIKS